jgi:phosphoribosylamine--glycine ligase
MRILLIESEALNLSFAVKCAEAGHTVYWYSYEANQKDNKSNVGKGFLPEGIIQIKNWVPYINQVDLTIHLDNNRFIERLDAFKKKGFPIYAPSTASAELEIKRERGLKFLKEHGIPVPDYFKFKTLDEAVAFLQKDKGRYVFKTLGDEEDKSMSYCSKDAGDMIEHINWLKLNKIAPKDAFILQKFIKGIEFAVNSWMGSRGFIGKFGEAFEHKGLASGELGPATGEMGTIHKYVTSSLYADKILKPLEAALVEMGHLGNIDVNCIIDEEGNIWPLEFTARHPYPGWMLMMAQHNGDPATWMLDAIKGKDTLDQKLDIGICVVLVVPPFPFESMGADCDRADGLPIYGVTKGNRKHLMPQFVRMGSYTVQDEKGNIRKEKGWVTAGTYVMVVNALGDSIEQCRTRVYKTIDQLHIPGMFYRDDIGEKVLKWLPELNKHGLGKEFK